VFAADPGIERLIAQLEQAEQFKQQLRPLLDEPKTRDALERFSRQKDLAESLLHELQDLKGSIGKKLPPKYVPNMSGTGIFKLLEQMVGLAASALRLATHFLGH
jgi:hypothetical protein